MVDHICEPLSSIRSTSADLKKSLQGAVKRPLTVNPLNWDIVSTGDYDGDGKSDILWRHSGGTVALWEMNGVTGTVKANLGLGLVDSNWSIVE